MASLETATVEGSKQRNGGNPLSDILFGWTANRSPEIGHPGMGLFCRSHPSRSRRRLEAFPHLLKLLACVASSSRSSSASGGVAGV